MIPFNRMDDGENRRIYFVTFGVCAEGVPRCFAVPIQGTPEQMDMPEVQRAIEIAMLEGIENHYEVNRCHCGNVGLCHFVAGGDRYFYCPEHYADAMSDVPISSGHLREG